MRKRFNAVADTITKRLGSPFALLLATLVIVVWAVTGPIFGFSDTWQLVINTGTTIVTFLMVFVIQNSQNRDAKAVHIKLDELIRAIEGARDRMALAETETEEEQERDIRELTRIAQRAAKTSSTVENEALEAADEAERLAANLVSDAPSRADEPRGTSREAVA
jgi:low affinity Fe/Cu permease